ncbi:uncharacterized protein LOC130669838 [Microplitis mediator]|uniref:uncharacterized protein LOC130669838 n=1 Tax=Microplitis mediator TaxID=375433 RepID=UPI002553434C|nr:uncharacterized protein LOC130669838 [Microplitis mediator]
MSKQKYSQCFDNLTEDNSEYGKIRRSRRRFKHAAKVLSTSEHRSADRFILYFENYIWQDNDSYYCNLCNKNLKKKNQVSLHITTGPHMKSLKNYLRGENIYESNLSSPRCQKLLKNNIFSFNSTQFKCWSCTEFFDGYETAEQHIASNHHLSNLRTNYSRISNLFKTRFDKNVSQIFDSTSLAPGPTDSIAICDKNIGFSASDESKFLNYFRNFIGHRINDFYCYLCKKNFASESLAAAHMNESRHGSLRKKTYEQNEIFVIENYNLKAYEIFVNNYIFPMRLKIVKCFLCKAKMTYPEVEEHLNGKRHRKECIEQKISNYLSRKKNILTGAGNSSVPQVENKIESNTSEVVLKEEIAVDSEDQFLKYFENYVSKRDDNYNCHLCSKILSSASLVMTHIEDPIHRNHLSEVQTTQIADEISQLADLCELFVTNDIFKFTNDKFKCFTCECTLDNCDNAVAHIESQHGIAIKLSNSMESSIAKNPSESAIPKSKFSEPDLVSGEPKNVNNVNNESESLINKDIESTASKKTKTLNELEDEFIEYFKNFIVISGDDYFCNLCGKYYSSSLIMAHINNSNHKNLLTEKRRQINFKEHKFVSTPNFYELLVRNDIFQLNPRNLKCFVCDRLVSEFPSAEDHINGVQHITKSRRIAKLNASTSITNNNKIHPNMKLVLPECKKDFAQYFENFIDKRNDGYYCHLCEVNFSTSSAVMTHIANLNHKNLLETNNFDSPMKSRIINTFYYSELFVRNRVFQCRFEALKCFACNVIITKFKNAHSHLYGQAHKDNCEPSSRSLAEHKTNLHQSDVTSDNNQWIYDRQVPETHPTCYEISSVPKVENKIESNTSEVVLKKEIAVESEDQFLKYFENYVSKRDDNYNCHLCSKILPSSSLVMTHIEDPIHRNHLNEVQTTQNTDEISQLANLCELFVTNDIFKFTNDNLKCFTCECTLDNCDNAVAHIESQHGIAIKLSNSMESSIEKNPSESAIPKSQSSEPDSVSDKPKNVNNDSDSLSNKNIESTASKKTKTLNELEDKFIEYFKNFIVISGDDYFCNLCGKYYSSSLITAHINNSNHKNLLIEKRRQINFKEDKFVSTPNFYELLVRNDIFQLNPRTLKCLVCDRIVSGYISAEDHINGVQHIAKSRRIAKLNASTPIIDNDKIHPNMKLVLPECKKDFAQYFENFIDKRNDGYYCHLCEVNFPTSSAVMKHIANLNHKNLLEKNNFDTPMKSKIKNTFYYSELFVRNSIFQSGFEALKCYVCNVIMTKLKKAHSHLYGQAHKDNREPSGQSLTEYETNLHQSDVTRDDQLIHDRQVPETHPTFHESPVNDSVPLNPINDVYLYFINYINMRQDNYYCSFCQLKLSSSQVYEHIVHPDHAIHVSQKRLDNKITYSPDWTLDFIELLVKNNIFQVGLDVLYCFICKCDLLYTNVEEHVDSSDHKINIEKEYFEINKIVPVDVSYKKSYSFVLSRDIYMYNDTKSKLVYCYICRDGLKCRVELHVHLTNHLWRLFIGNEKIDLVSFVNLHSNVKIVIKTDGDFDKEVSETIREMKNAQAEHLSKFPKKFWKKNPGTSKIDFREERLSRKKLKNGKATNVCARINKAKVDIDTGENKRKYDVYKMEEETRHSIQLSFNRICIVNNDNIYCMICRRNVLFSMENIYGHFRGIEHAYFLTQMVQDHEKFEAFPYELSDLALARELIEDKTDQHVVCYACDPLRPVAIPNNIDALKTHVNSQNHLKKRAELSNNLRHFIDTFYSWLECDWFSVQRYRCVVCSKQFMFEKLFHRHLNSKSHLKKCEKKFKREKLVCQYCPTCGIIFYECKNTISCHFESELHELNINKNIHFISQLPDGAEELLIKADEVVSDICEKLNEGVDEMRKNEQLLLDDLENTIKDYVDAKIHPFGSRISGLGSSNSDLDVFLDCDDLYYKGSVSDDISFFLKEVEHSLKMNENVWSIKEVIASCRIPIIRIVHKPTNIDCDISFTNGLAVENTKLVRAYLDKYPLCRKLILFIKNWTNICNLNGENGICSYAIAWMVIYYLQTKFILPNVVNLIKLEGKSSMIGGWETGVSRDFTLSDISNNYSFKNLLKGFFIMCAGFDYRNNIFCPLLGRPVRKIDFIVPRKLTKLPGEMKNYKNYIQENKDVKYFRSDAVMGVQDPFDLSHNLTKVVKKTTVYRFKTLCSLSAEKLNNVL